MNTPDQTLKFFPDVFYRQLKAFGEACHTTSVKHGFYTGADNRNIPTKICLLHSEVSELLEAFRQDDPVSTKNIPLLINTGEIKNRYMTSMEEEAADILIRLVDFCEFAGIPLAEAAIAKAEYNRSRPHMHGGKVI